MRVCDLPSRFVNGARSTDERPAGNSGNSGNSGDPTQQTARDAAAAYSSATASATGSATAPNALRIPTQSPPALTDSTPDSNAPADGTRVKRGPVFSSCITDHGGTALAHYSIASEHFDQGDYAESKGLASGGLCEGMVREVMRRIDRIRDGSPGPTGVPGRVAMPMMSAVHDMRADARWSSAARPDLFSRIQRFQNSRTPTLAFNGYTRHEFISFRSSESRDSRMVRFFNHINSSLEHPNDMAYVQLSLETDNHRHDYGHAILVQRGAAGHYSIFDPNNGAYEYANWTDTRHALQDYMDTAFSHRSSPEDPILGGTRPMYRVVPFKMQQYSSTPPVTLPGQQSQTQPPALAPRPGAAGYGPPETLCDDQIYRQYAQSSNPITIDGLFPQGPGQAGVRRAAESMGSYVLQEVAAGRAPNLNAAANGLSLSLGNPNARADVVGDLNARESQYQSASTTELQDHTRHAGTLHVPNAEALVQDMRDKFGAPYIGEGGSTRFQNDLAVVDLNLGAGAAGGSRREPSRPVLIQRLQQSNDFATDLYQVYDPNFGVYTYRGFDDMSDALRRMYNAGYRDEGGVVSATTTWYSGQSGIEDTSLTTFQIPPSARAPNVTLDGVEHLVGQTHPGPHVAPRRDLPAAPDENHIALQDAFQKVDLKKRSTGLQTSGDPWVVFRPSMESPQSISSKGGFSAGSTPLRDVSLLTHDFDVAAHGGLTDSAGYLGTFEDPLTAIERQRQQPRQGFIYAIAPSPNMVDVNASLGRYTQQHDSHEFAAMGHIDSTQIMGWWRMEDLEQGRKNAFVANPEFRWDVYSHTPPAGAQPQLARFPMNSPAWQDPVYRPFAADRGLDGRPKDVIPKQDPNLTQASFYADAMMKIDQARDRQANGKDYRGPLTLKPYGGETDYIVYADGSDQPYIGKKSAVDQYPENKKQFALGGDGRFHYADDYQKVLLVGHDGYLYVGPIPSNPRLVNGVFHIDGSNPARLIHVEDGKYLTVGKSGWTPYVENYDTGSRSRWALTNPKGTIVRPPAVNFATFLWEKDFEARKKLFHFVQNPESQLPPGTSQFLTQGMPGSPDENPEEDLAHAVDHLQRFGGADVVIQTMMSENAAWIFRDGFYAVPVRRDLLEFRTLSGRTVLQAKVDLTNGKESWTRLGSISSYFHIDDDTWNDLKAREYRRFDLRYKLPAG